MRWRAAFAVLPLPWYLKLWQLSSPEIAGRESRPSRGQMCCHAGALEMVLETPSIEASGLQCMHPGQELWRTLAEMWLTTDVWNLTKPGDIKLYSAAVQWPFSIVKYLVSFSLPTFKAMAALATKFRMPTKPLASEACVADVTIKSFQFQAFVFQKWCTVLLQHASFTSDILIVV